MISEEIERLVQLRDSGALSEEEFQQAKGRVLSGASAFSGGAGDPASPQSGQILGFQADIWCALMHASQLLTWTGVGVVAPLVMWILSKDESRQANRHGLMIINWLLSSLVYLIISGVACLLVIGIPMLMVLAGLNIAFPVIGAWYASRGILWNYPLTIQFFDVSSAET